VYLRCEYIDHLTRALIILLTDHDGQTEKLIASAHRAVVRAERKMRRALQVRSYSTRKDVIIDYFWNSQLRRKMIHDHRRTQTSAAKVEEVPAEQKGRSQPPPPLRVDIPRTESPKTSPVQSPSTRSTTSSMSSLASVQAEGEGTETETDTGILRRLYLKKVEGRLEGAYDELEKADVWLKIVKTVLEDVERRGLDERM
jgi:hypothetical protein